MLAPLLPGFLARHQRVRPEVVLSLRTVDLVREGFDIGIRVTMKASLPSSALIAKKLGPLNIGLYAGTQYAARRELPKQPRDLLEHDNVVFFPGDANEYVMKGPKGAARLKVPGRVSGDDFFFIREAVVAGVGIGPMPWFMASHELAAGRVVRALPDYQAMPGAMYLVYPPAKPLPPKVAAFTTYLREHAPPATRPRVMQAATLMRQSWSRPPRGPSTSSRMQARLVGGCVAVLYFRRSSASLYRLARWLLNEQ